MQVFLFLVVVATCYGSSLADPELDDEGVKREVIDCLSAPNQRVLEVNNIVRDIRTESETIFTMTAVLWPDIRLCTLKLRRQSGGVQTLTATCNGEIDVTKCNRRVKRQVDNIYYDITNADPTEWVLVRTRIQDGLVDIKRTQGPNFSLSLANIHSVRKSVIYGTRYFIKADFISPTNRNENCDVELSDQAGIIIKCPNLDYRVGRDLVSIDSKSPYY